VEREPEQAKGGDTEEQVARELERELFVATHLGTWLLHRQIQGKESTGQ